MINLLVSAINGNVSTGILRSLSGKGYGLIGCDPGQYPVGMDIAEKWFRVPFANDAAYIPVLIDACREYDIRVVLPVNEAEIAVTDDNRAAFDEAGIRLVINNSFILRTCMDKYRCMKELAKIGVAVPDTMPAENADISVGQYIVKPRQGCGSKFLKIIHGKKEFSAALAEYTEPLIVQEYMPDESEEYTMGVFSDGDEVRTIVFRRKLTHGFTAFVELVQNDEMEEIGHTVAEAWNLCGSINIQMRKHNGRAHVFEINPRLSGTTHFRALLGFNDAHWWCETVLGRNIPPYHPEVTRAVGVREMKEKILYLEK